MLRHVFPRTVVGIELSFLLNNVVLILVNTGNRGGMRKVEIIDQCLRAISVEFLRAQIYVYGVL